MIMLRLVFAQLNVRRVRTCLTAAAVALSVSLVVAVTSGYASAESSIVRFFTRYMGGNDIQITRKGVVTAGIDQSVLAAVERDEDVSQVIGRLENQMRLVNKAGVPMWFVQVIGVMPEDSEATSLHAEKGQWFDQSQAAGGVAVLDQVAAEHSEAEIGSTIQLAGLTEALKLRVVGIVRKPAILAEQSQTIYVPLRTLQKFLHEEGKVTRAMVVLRTGAKAGDFNARWSGRMEQSNPPLRLQTAADNRKQMEKNLQGVRLLSYLGGTVSMVAAAFIILSALSMGVAERSRTLAMLRAVGATRSQLAGTVLLEGVVLSLLGVIVGLPMGLLWVKILTMWKHGFFAAGMSISGGGVLLAALGSIAAALAASGFPAWTATHVDPLEALCAVGRAVVRVFPWRPALVGVALLAIDPLLAFVPGLDREVRFYGHFTMGLPGEMVGYLLLAPLLVGAANWALTPMVAKLSRIDPVLLRQQLGDSNWRAAGTCAALMVGLAILTVMHVLGNSWLSRWQLPDKFPDMFIFSPVGLNEAQQKLLDDLPGVRKTMINGVQRSEVMPIAMAAPDLKGWGILGVAFMPTTTLFLGVDPEKSLAMVELKFREGNVQDATRRLKAGRHIIITEEISRLKDLHVGDKLPFHTLHGDAEYTIAAVVWSPGIDVIAAVWDLHEEMEQRAASTVFGSLDDLRRDFGEDRVRLFAVNLAVAGKSRDTVVAEFHRTLGGMGLVSGDVRQVKYDIENGFRRALLMMSTVAFAAMAVAALGVANTIMAGIRSRRWQFGILRSIGLTQGRLLRMVMAEAVVLGVVGCILGLACGMQMSVDANGLSRWLIGGDAPLVLPWGILAIGVAVVMLVSLVAAIVPALSVAGDEPLALLQAGRAAE